MRKSIYKFTLSCVIFILLNNTSSSAQELIYEIPLHVQIASSDQIVEGQVVSKASTWDESHSNIYTLNTIKVFKAFKGDNTPDLIDIITPGGTVGSKMEIVTPSLDLQIGDIGVFILSQSTITMSSDNRMNDYQPVASTQGFYKYDLSRNVVYNPFMAKQGISEEFYSTLLNLNNRHQINEVSVFDVNEAVNQINRNSNGTLSITDFSPTTVNGGVRDILTVNGTGFGNTPGTIEFRDANFGGQNDMGPVYIAALSGQVIAWTDTQIQVEVPSRAGTGDFRVLPSVGGSVVSNEGLNVFYSQINPSNETNAFQTQHYDANGIGGYTWQMHTEFDNNALARASFIRAFDSWVCTTGINWNIGPVTPVDMIAEDGINIIRFDNADELPQGVLGRTSTRFDICENLSSPIGVSIIVTELDIVFNDVFTGNLSNIVWQFGPNFATSGEVDFETIAIHELGHAHQLAHIINPGDIMHFSASIAQNSRILGASDLAGGNDVMDRNVNNPVCNEGAMTYSECSALSIIENELNESISIFPNPAEDVLTISVSSSIIIEDAIVYDMNGRAVISVNFENTNNYFIDVSVLQTGVYLIKLFSKSSTISKKLIIN